MVNPLQMFINAAARKPKGKKRSFKNTNTVGGEGECILLLLLNYE